MTKEDSTGRYRADKCQGWNHVRLQRYDHSRSIGRKFLPQGLPNITREPVSQIYEKARKLVYRSWVHPCAVYGDAEIGAQLRQLERGCDLVVTPNRFDRAGSYPPRKYSILCFGRGGSHVGYGFRTTDPTYREGEDMSLVNDRQALMFSATFPRNVQMLAHDLLKDRYVFLI